MSEPLIATRWRNGALVAVSLAVLVTGWLAVVSYDSSATTFDEWVLRTSVHRIGANGARQLLRLSEPGVSFAVVLAVGVVAAVARRWALVALASIGPIAAVVLTEYVLKPAVGRFLSLPGVPESVLREMFSGSFPSGHETGVASAAVLVLVACGQLRLARAVRALIIAVLLAWTFLAALGLVRNLYHYATDTIGALGVSVATVLGVALLLDRCSAPLVERLRGSRRRELAARS